MKLKKNLKQKALKLLLNNSLQKTKILRAGHNSVPALVVNVNLWGDLCKKFIDTN